MAVIKFSYDVPLHETTAFDAPITCRLDVIPHDRGNPERLLASLEPKGQAQGQSGPDRAHG